MHCRMNHSSDCKECFGFQSVTTSVLENGFLELADAFRAAFPFTTYPSHSAKRRLLRLPLAALRLGNTDSGQSEVYLVEHSPAVNYCKVVNLLSSLHSMAEASPNMKKQELKELLQLAQSDRERECIRYTAWRASGLSTTAARKHLGLEGMNCRADCIQRALEEAQAIREAVDGITRVQEKSAFQPLGFTVSDSSSSGSNSEDMTDALSSSDETENPSQSHREATVPELILLLRSSSVNWFQLIDLIEEQGIDKTSTERSYEALIKELSLEERKLVANSH